MRRGAAQSERGAVLLTTLLVMSIMAAVAVAMIDDIRFGVKRASNIQAHAQAEWYVKGAEGFAQSYLEQQIRNASEQQLNAAMLSGEPIVFPIEGGAISLRVKDGSQCVSLGGLNNSPGRRQFRQLLVAIGWAENEAARMTSVVADWVDEDSQVLPGGAEDFVYMGRIPAYRTPNAPFNSVMELHAIDGMDEDKYQALRPFICARPEGAMSSININTLTLDQAPVLAAMLGGENSFAIASRLIAERPEAGFKNLAALTTSPALADEDLKDAALENISFAPDYIFIEADIYYNEAHRSAAYEYSILNGNVELIYKREGQESFRPAFLEAKS